MSSTTVEVAPAEEVAEQFVVRLLFKFDAASPADAVEKMIRELADNGLRNWHYRVENQATGELFFVTGYGETKSIEELLEDEEDDGDDDEPGDADQS